jgi:fibronectin type 3 domain-containing protein/DNA-binding beta-propeller fold protein YncE
MLHAAVPSPPRPARIPGDAPGVVYERELSDPAWKSLVDVAADGAGNICVLDASTHKAFVFDAGGRPVLSIGEKRFWSSTFPRPSGAAADRAGRIYISDSRNHSVRIHDRTGVFAAKIGGKGRAPGRFRDPVGVAIDDAGTIYVADRGNNRVQRFDADGTLVGQIVSGPKAIDKIDISRTSGPLRFVAWPRFTRIEDVAVGLDGIIYVLDSGTRAVHAYTPRQTYLFSFGGRGKGPGRFEKPSGIAVGAMGIVCVSDEKNDAVQFFDPQGRFLAVVGGRGKGRGQFREPQGVGTGPNGLVCVADRGNRRVQLFSLAVPRVEEAPAARLEKPLRIAVFDFKNNNPQARERGYGETISEMFITAFARRPNFEVVERKQIRKLLDELYFGQSGAVDEETTKKLGRVLGVDVALAGGVSFFAGAIEVDLRLLDVETGKVILPDALKVAADARLRETVEREVGRIEAAYLIRFHPPAPPAGLVATGGVREASLSWRPNAEPDLKGYRIRRAEAEGGPYAVVGETEQTDWIDRGLADGASLFYRLTAVDTDGRESAPCAASPVRTRGRPEIGELRVQRRTAVGASSFSWAEGEEDVVGYAIYRAASRGGEYVKAGETRTPGFSEKGLANGETRYYRVVKRYRNGLESEPSIEFAAGAKPPPSPPAGFCAQGGLARRVRLEWDPPKEKDIREYRIHRSGSESGGYREIASVKPGWFNRHSHTDTGLDDDTAYYYTIEAVDADNLSSAISAPVKAVTKRAPSPPRDLAAEGGKARRVPLAWDRNPEADIAAYRVFVSESGDGPFRQIAETAAPAFVHAGLGDRTARFYRVRAVDRDGLLSGFSETVSAATRPLPSRPEGLKAESGLPRSVRLAWTPNPEPDIARYTVRRLRRGAFSDVGEVRTPGYTDTGLEDGVTYRYEVRAVDAEGLVSPPSEQVEASTKPRPSAPAKLNAEARGDLIALSWTASPEHDIAGYEIYRRSGWNPLAGEEKVGRVSATSFEDRTAAAGTACTYRVCAIDAAGLASDRSDEASAEIRSGEGSGWGIPGMPWDRGTRGDAREPARVPAE